MIPSFLLQKEISDPAIKAVKQNLSFIDKTIKNAAGFISTSFLQWHTANKNGLMQLIDSRIKVLFLFLAALLTGISHNIISQIIIAGLLLILYLFSRLNLFPVYKRILLVGFVFGFLVFIPASLNIFTEGTHVIPLLHFSRSHSWWIYTIPEEIAITNEGIHLVILLTLKVLNSVAIALLVIYTTTFERIVKALSFFKIPDIFLLTLTLTYKFIFILSHTIIEIYRAIKMRWWNRESSKHTKEILAGRISYLFRRSWERYELVYMAMTARGLHGRVNFCYLNRLKPADYIFSTISFLFFILVLLADKFLWASYLH